MFFRNIIYFITKLYSLNFKKSSEEFLDLYFSSKKQKYILQIGANDGIQNDSLRKHLLIPGDYEATLLEPLPYYFKKLNDLYVGRKNIEIIQTACDCENSTRKIYFIDPEVADKMNGDGPINNWAHGQGSFSKEEVIWHIKKNKFRGKEYRKNINKFINSIKSIKINCYKASEFLKKHNNSLVIIDVQGFEFEVLLGLDFELNPPKYLIVEDDRVRDKSITKFLKNKKYKWIAGTDNKVYKLMK